MMAPAAAAPAGADEGGVKQLRAGKRPRPEGATPIVVRRRPLVQHKWALLEREQELDRRRVEEVSSPLKLQNVGWTSFRGCWVLVSSKNYI